MAKSILSEEQKKQVINCLMKNPDLTSKEVADILSFPLECVRSLKAHLTMGTYGSNTPSSQPTEEVEISLGMERDLQNFLLNDLSQLEEGLSLYENGKEYSIDVGRIDILATDKNGDFVVIELKAGKAKDDSVGQLLGYIGYVREKISKEKKVRGYIVANDFEDRVKYAVKNIPDVKLKAYSVKFYFKEVC